MLRAAESELDLKLYLNIAAFIAAPPLLVVMFAAFVNSLRVFEAAIRPIDFASFVATSSDFSVSSTALRKSFCAWLSVLILYNGSLGLSFGYGGGGGVVGAGGAAIRAAAPACKRLSRSCA